MSLPNDANDGNPLLAAALAYAARGWPVLPCRARAKKPVTAHGVHDATTAEATIRAWWTRWPEANVGIATGGGPVVVDVDGETGAAALAGLESAHGDLPTTVTAITGRGRHYYFTAPAGSVRCAVAVAGLTGFDIRGEGGYVVAPPSRHESGATYAWLDEQGPDDIDLAPLPAWIADLPALVAPPPADAGNGTDALVDLLAAALRPGVHHAVGLRVGADLVGAGVGLDEAGAIMRAACQRAGGDAGGCVRALRNTYARHDGRPLAGIESLDAVPGGLRAAIRAAIRAMGGGTDAPAPVRQWPDPPAPEAYHGLAGDIVRAIEPTSEADPVALLVQLLVAFGSAANRSAYFAVEADRHHLNLYAVLVGATAKARKGTSWGRVRHVMEAVDPGWDTERVVSGLSSGEGLIYAVRDPVEVEEETETGETVTKVLDPGVTDKRLLVYEAELAGPLAVMRREGNILSVVLRDAWDTGTLGTLTKTSHTRATGAHVSVIAHVTRAELLRLLDDTAAANGLGNRFLWLAVRRSKLLPEGARLDEATLAPLAPRLTDALRVARTTIWLARDEAARALWAEVYPTLSEGRPGLLGAMTARAEAQVTRLSCLYALLDGTPTIGVPHLRAALALWDYCDRSARWVFGDALGDPVADAVLDALRAAGDAGMSRTELRDLFQRNREGAQIAGALRALAEAGLAVMRHEDTGGRPAERWYYATTKTTKTTKGAADQ